MTIAPIAPLRRLRFSSSRAPFLALALVLVTGCDGQEEARQPSAGAPAGAMAKSAPVINATRVEVATIQPSTAKLQLTRPGEVEGSKSAHVGTSLGGLVESVRVEVGRKISKGQLLAKIDAELQEAQTDLARIEVEDAERELERLSGLGKSVASVRVDQARTRVQRARANHRLAKIQVDRSVIRAPFSGVVTHLHVERGEVAPPGGRVVTLVRLDPVVVSVAVSDRDLGGLKVGDPATIHSAASAQPISGKISRIEPTAGLKTRSFKVEVEVRNRKHELRPGMIATVDFHQTMSGERIILPQDVLVTRLDSNGVFVVDGSGHARWRELRLGTIIRDQVVVDSGLEAGERVVVQGHRSLQDGDPLLVARQGRCCEEGRVIFGERSLKIEGAGDVAAAIPDAAPAEKSASPNKGSKSSAKASKRASSKGSGKSARGGSTR